MFGVSDGGMKQGGIMSFFRKQKKRGRPKKKATKTPKATSPTKTPALPSAPRRKMVRHSSRNKNWTKGEGLLLLTSMISDWDNKEGTLFMSLGPGKVGLNRYCHACEKEWGIGWQTLKAYLHGDPSKRRLPGGQRGRKPVIPQATTSLITQVVRKADRQNKGMSSKDIVAAVRMAGPGLSKKQAENHTFNTLLPNARKEKKLTGSVKVQATTVGRSNVTRAQQFRWFTLIDDMDRELAKRNVDDGTGVVWDDVKGHFSFNLDEECVLACDGLVKIVGDASKKKHERMSGNSRVSITALRCGSAEGGEGPSMFLMAGQKRKSTFTDNFLERHGAKKGSSIEMTPTAFLTHDAWDHVAAKIADGMRAMPVVCDHPGWWLKCTLDGFGSHKMTEVAMRSFHERKIMIGVEEGDTSQIDQAFDQDVAKKGKAEDRSLLDLVRGAEPGKKITQWDLLLIVLGALRNSTVESWRSSFIKTNTHPCHRMSFDDWCKKISPSLWAGQNFDRPVIDKRALLPAFWLHLPVTQKASIMSTVQKFEEDWGDAELVAALRKDPCSVPFLDLQTVRVGYIVEKEEAAKDKLRLGGGEASTSNASSSGDSGSSSSSSSSSSAGGSDGGSGKGSGDTAMAESSSSSSSDRTTLASIPIAPPLSINNGLPALTLKPSGLTGMALFAHVCRYRNRHMSEGKSLEVSASLDVEMTGEQRQILQPSVREMNEGALMRRYAGDETHRLPARVLNTLGETNSHCVVANDPRRLARLRDVSLLANSMAEVKQAEEAAKAKAAKQKMDMLRSKFETAKPKMTAHGNDPAKAGVTMDEMRAVAKLRYGKTLKASKKAPMVVELTALVSAAGDLGVVASSKGASASGKGAAASGKGKKGGGGKADGAAAVDDRTFDVGDIVDGNYLSGGSWHPGKIAKKHEDNTYDVLYDDGDSEEHMPTSRLSRVHTAAEAALLTGRGKGKRKARDDDDNEAEGDSKKRRRVSLRNKRKAGGDNKVGGSGKKPQRSS